MTALTLICATNSAGDFADENGKPWNAGGELLRETIKGKAIIIGRKTLEKDWRGLTGARTIICLSRHYSGSQEIQRIFDLKLPNVSFAHDIGDALHIAHKTQSHEVFCAGGKQTIEAFAPFASRVLLTHILDEDDQLAVERAAGCERDGECSETLPMWLPASVTELMAGHDDECCDDEEYFTAWNFIDEADGSVFPSQGRFYPLDLDSDDLSHGYKRFDLRRCRPIEF